MGDWVLLREAPEGVLSEAIQPRRNAVQRKASGAFTGRQTVAANLDRVFVVTSMNNDLKLSRIERFLVATSALYGTGLEELRARLGGTSALVGMSGVGKSSLLNALAGEELIDTGGIRERDARGKHTTTRRQLFVLPGLGVFIDTPGMRELALTLDAAIEAGELSARRVTNWSKLQKEAAGARRRQELHLARRPGSAGRPR